MIRPKDTRLVPNVSSPSCHQRKQNTYTNIRLPHSHRLYITFTSMALSHHGTQLHC